MTFPAADLALLETHYASLLAGCAPRNPAHRTSDSDWNQACLELKTAAEQHNLSSLSFAVTRLEYWRINGVGSINVAGTMGSGKSSVAASLATPLRFTVKDADLFHPDENRSKMSNGVPLTHADRYPFYAGVQSWLKESGRITSCSALTHLYRAIIAGQDSGVLLDTSHPAWQDPWSIQTPNLGMFPIIVKKPYDVALSELDAANKSEKTYRELDGKRHYIQVTYETERDAEAQGKAPLLKSQYSLLEREPVFAWDAYVLEASSLKDGDGIYANQEPIRKLLNLLPSRPEL
jgi:hypothetical protein